MQHDHRYHKAWEGYWASFVKQDDRPFWDAPPQQGVAVDLTRFQDCMDLALPLIDFGCGHGAQTRFLAQHFRRVLGVDIAPAAIKRAIALGQPGNVSYRVLDALRPDEAQELHDEVGDANIYMRGVLHQLSAADQQICVDTLSILLGGSGALYMIEVATTAKAYMARLLEGHGGRPPEMLRTQEHGIASVGVERGGVIEMFGADRFDVLSEGDAVIETIDVFLNGEPAQIPAHYLVLRRRQD